MSRLPPALQPMWPMAKRVHRLASLVLGILNRRLSVLWGDRRLPWTASPTSASTAAAEPADVRVHLGPRGGLLPRTLPIGDPPAHWAFRVAAALEAPDQFAVEIERGTVVGEYAAVITPGGRLDYETSPYFGIDGWREHPLFLRPRLPRIEDVPGRVAVLGTRGGNANYYHYLLDVLPRLGVLEASMPGVQPDALYLPSQTRYQKELLSLLGLDSAQLIQPAHDRAVRAEVLLVPNLPNDLEIAPDPLVHWLRDRLPALDTADKPRRLFVTRGQRRNTRRLECEGELWPQLERHGFVRVDPGAMSVRDQIDHFAAAEAIIGVHGAALTNLVFAREGVKVLHLLAPGFVKHCFWSITETIPGAEYRYLLGDGRPSPEGSRMTGVQDDIAIAPEKVLAELDWLLG